MEERTVADEPTRELPCDICGEPCKVTRADTEWAVHWECILYGKARVQEARRALSTRR
jgi:hypothetical protein